jgi:hypothetical protein
MATVLLSLWAHALGRTSGPPSGPSPGLPVEPASPDPLTGAGPLAAPRSAVPPPQAAGRPVRARSEFEGRPRAFRPRDLLPPPLPDATGSPRAAAILREPSEGTSYQAARLVFRTFARLPRAIRASAALRASPGVSPGFAPGGQSSRSFGSRRGRSRSAPPPEGGRVGPPGAPPEGASLLFSWLSF